MFKKLSVFNLDGYAVECLYGVTIQIGRLCR